MPSCERYHSRCPRPRTVVEERSASACRFELLLTVATGAGLRGFGSTMRRPTADLVRPLAVPRTVTISATCYSLELLSDQGQKRPARERWIGPWVAIHSSRLAPGASRCHDISCVKKGTG